MNLREREKGCRGAKMDLLSLEVSRSMHSLKALKKSAYGKPLELPMSTMASSTKIIDILSKPTG